MQMEEKSKMNMFKSRWKDYPMVFAELVSLGLNGTVLETFDPRIMKCTEADLDSMRTFNDTDETWEGTLLMYSVTKDRKELFNFLVDKACNMTKVDEDENNILHLACMAGSVEFVDRIFATGKVEKESRGVGELTPLLCAARSNMEVFKFLLEKGCNTSAVDDSNNNILHLASEMGNLDIVKYILELDLVDKESRGYNDMTPLLLAADEGCAEVFAFLVRQGCNVAAVDTDNNNVLHLSSMCGSIEIVQLILPDTRIDKDSRGNHQMTPIMCAVESGNREMFNFLVNQSCDVNAINKNNDTILHLASEYGTIDIVKDILSRNLLDINTRGQQRKTPLMSAAENGRREMMHFLINETCDVTAVDEDNDNILHYASMYGHIDIVRDILAKNLIDKDSRGHHEMTSLMYAAENDFRDVFDFLLDKGNDLQAVDDVGNNILHISCIGGFVEMVEYVISLKVFSVESRNGLGMTPLLWTARKGYVDVFDFLLKQGCDSTAVNKDKRTILHLAVAQENEDLVRRILDIPDMQHLTQVKDIDGMTPIDIAKEYDYTDLELLLQPLPKS